MTMAKGSVLSQTFRAKDLCYYEIYSPNQGENYNLDIEDDGTYYINITVDFSNSTVYLNNGSDYFNASDEL